MGSDSCHCPPTGPPPSPPPPCLICPRPVWSTSASMSPPPILQEDLDTSCVKQIGLVLELLLRLLHLTMTYTCPQDQDLYLPAVPLCTSTEISTIMAAVKIRIGGTLSCPGVLVLIGH